MTSVVAVVAFFNRVKSLSPPLPIQGQYCSHTLLDGVQLAQHIIHTIMKVLIDTVMLLIYAGVKIMHL